MINKDLRTLKTEKPKNVLFTNSTLNKCGSTIKRIKTEQQSKQIQQAIH